MAIRVRIEDSISLDSLEETRRVESIVAAIGSLGRTCWPVKKKLGLYFLFEEESTNPLSPFSSSSTYPLFIPDSPRNSATFRRDSSFPFPQVLLLFLSRSIRHWQYQPRLVECFVKNLSKSREMTIFQISNNVT